MWCELGTCRQMGAALGPIPITASWAYVDRYHLPEWAVDAMITLDAAWREAEARKAAASIEGANIKPGLPRPRAGRHRHGRK